MKKTLALLLAIWGTTSFANPKQTPGSSQVLTPSDENSPPSPCPSFVDFDISECGNQEQRYVDDSFLSPSSEISLRTKELHREQVIPRLPTNAEKKLKYVIDCLEWKKKRIDIHILIESDRLRTKRIELSAAPHKLDVLSEQEQLISDFREDLERFSPPHSLILPPEWLEKLRVWITYIRSEAFVSEYNRLTSCFEQQWTKLEHELLVEDEDDKGNKPLNLSIRDDLYYYLSPAVIEDCDKIFTHWPSREAAPLWLNPWIDECISQGRLTPLSNFLLTHKDRGYGVPSADDELMAKETYFRLTGLDPFMAKDICYIVKAPDSTNRFFQLHLPTLSSLEGAIMEKIRDNEKILHHGRENIARHVRVADSLALKLREIFDMIDEVYEKVDSLLPTTTEIMKKYIKNTLPPKEESTIEQEANTIRQKNRWDL